MLILSLINEFRNYMNSYFSLFDEFEICENKLKSRIDI